MSSPQCTTREQWLAALVVALRPMFLQHGATIPAKVRVSWLDNAGAPTCACGAEMAEVSS